MINCYLMLNAKTTDQSSLIDFPLGAGKKFNNYTVAILIRVCGMYKTFTDYNIFVQVSVD